MPSKFLALFLNRVGQRGLSRKTGFFFVLLPKVLAYFPLPCLFENVYCRLPVRIGFLTIKNYDLAENEISLRERPKKLLVGVAN